MHEDHLPTSGSYEISHAGWVILLPLALALAAYLTSAHRLRITRGTWQRRRDVAFALGIMLAAWAVSPPMSHNAHEDLRLHMVQHLTLGMLAPLCLVLAAPMSLVLKSAPVDTGRSISSFLKSRPLQLMSHPVTALSLNFGGMYLLYLTPLFSFSMRHPALHLLLNAHFLAAGYLFVWSIAGRDPAPRRPGYIFRVAVLMLSIGLHAFLAKLMYAHLLPRDARFTADEIREAAMVMYYGGDIAEILLAVALFASWFGPRRRRRYRLAAQRQSPFPVAAIEHS